MEKARSLVSALLVACGIAQTPAPKDVGIVVDRNVYNDFWSWSATPWFRPSGEELEFPVYVLIDLQGRACIVQAADWVTVLDGEYYDCATGWLRRRASTI